MTDEEPIHCEKCGKQMTSDEVAYHYLEDGPSFCAACAPTPKEREADRAECREATLQSLGECPHLDECGAAEACFPTEA